MGLTLIWMVSNGDVGSSPRRQSGGAKDSDFTTSISPTPGAWVRVRVKQGGQKKERKQKGRVESKSQDRSLRAYKPRYLTFWFE